MIRNLIQVFYPYDRPTRQQRKRNDLDRLAEGCDVSQMTRAHLLTNKLNTTV
jgi:hypothetical protein